MYKEYKQFPVLAKANLKLRSSNQMQPTEEDIEGPYYTPNAPELNSDGKLIDNPNFVLFGRVYNTDGEPLENVTLDFWQADEKGEYDNKGYNLRGKVVTDKKGNFMLQTLKPGNYAISENEFRCSHLHVILTVKGYKSLTTQLYFEDDKHNSEDKWFDLKRVIFESVYENKHFGYFLFVLQKENK